MKYSHEKKQSYYRNKNLTLDPCFLVLFLQENQKKRCKDTHRIKGPDPRLHAANKMGIVATIKKIMFLENVIRNSP